MPKHNPRPGRTAKQIRRGHRLGASIPAQQLQVTAHRGEQKYCIVIEGRIPGTRKLHHPYVIVYACNEHVARIEALERAASWYKLEDAKVLACFLRHYTLEDKRHNVVTSDVPNSDNTTLHGWYVKTRGE